MPGAGHTERVLPCQEKESREKQAMHGCLPTEGGSASVSLQALLEALEAKKRALALQDRTTRAAARIRTEILVL